MRGLASLVAVCPSNDAQSMPMAPLLRKNGEPSERRTGTYRRAVYRREEGARLMLEDPARLMQAELRFRPSGPICSPRAADGYTVVAQKRSRGCSATPTHESRRQFPGGIQRGIAMLYITQEEFA
jgi:hypothetical protein